MAAAASLLPPPSPAATGTSLRNVKSSGGSGRGEVAPQGGGGAQHEVVAVRPGRQAGHRQAVRGGVGGGWCPGGSGGEAIREAEADHDRRDVVETVGAPWGDGQGEVDLGVRRRAALVHGSGSQGGREGQPVLHRSVCGRRSGAMPTWASAASDGGPLHRRQLPRQHVVEHLAALAEAGLDEPPQVLLRGRVQAARARLTDQDGGRDLRRRLERLGRHDPRDPYAGVVLDEHGEVAQAARRRGDPLGHLALDHQHEALRTGLAAQRVVQDRAGDVVRQVGHDVPGRGDERGEVLVERVALDEW